MRIKLNRKSLYNIKSTPDQLSLDKFPNCLVFASACCCCCCSNASLQQLENWEWAFDSFSSECHLPSS